MISKPSISRACRWQVAASVGMGVVCAMLFFSQAAANANAAPSSIGAGFETAGNNHAPAHVNNRLNASLGPGTHYIYAQDGTCPDGIDAFKVSGTTLTLIQNVGVGCSSDTTFGHHHLAVVRTPANCLLFTDGDGNVYSFTISPNSGVLSTSPASSINIPDTSPPRFSGGDLAVSGSTVFLGRTFGEVEPFGEIDVLSVGAGCALTLESQNSTGPELDINWALYNATTVVSADVNSASVDPHSGDIVAYTLQPNNTLIETAHSPGQIPGLFPDTGPDSVAVLYGNVYTGQATSAPPQAQGLSFDGSSFTPVAGSPQTANPETSNGAAVAGSANNHILIQANQFSSQISWYSLAGGGGRMSSGGDTPLQNAGLRAAQVTIAGNDLLVAQNHGGDLEDCALAPDSVSNCHSIATLTGAGSGVGASAAIF